MDGAAGRIQEILAVPRARSRAPEGIGSSQQPLTMVRASGPFTGPTFWTGAQIPSMPLQRIQGFRGPERRLQPVLKETVHLESFEEILQYAICTF